VQRIRRGENIATAFRRLLKISGIAGSATSRKSFFQPVRFRGNGVPQPPQMAGFWPESPGFVLNAPLSSFICVNDPVSSWGLNKSDHD
jgi:hypothetical protein